MLNGLDLFSGGGGAALALEPWIRTVAYCESDESAQGVLLERQQAGEIGVAPIWDDLRTLARRHIGVPVDAIYGGWPCQDISSAGLRRGLEGERSGLIYEVLRLVGEFRPAIVFLENSPMVTVSGLERILLEFDALGYDARWTIVSAEEMGAPHLRERFWFFAHADRNRIWEQPKCIQWSEGPTFAPDDREASIANALGERLGTWGAVRQQSRSTETDGTRYTHLDPLRAGRQRWIDAAEAWQALALGSGSGSGGWPSWLPQPCVGRDYNGIPSRMDRLKIMGNAWVPQAGRRGFQRLGGIA